MLALATSNPRFYQRAVKELKKEGVNFLSIKPGDDIPPNVDLIITSNYERDSIAFSKVIAASDAVEAVSKALQTKTGLKKIYRAMFIGIDPGKSIGVAVLGDNQVVYEEILSSPEDVVVAINKIKKLITAQNTKVRVGSSGGAYRNRIIANIQENFDYTIEVVDENSTSRPRREMRMLGVQRDVLSARKIAAKKGRTITWAVDVATTPGEIKNIQGESRKQSGNLTISKKLAEAVVKGEMGMDEAIRMQRRHGDEGIGKSTP